MSTLTLKLYASDYEGNDQYYDITINLDTREIEQREDDEKVRYSPSIKVTSVEIVMEQDLLVKVLGKDDKGNYFLDAYYDLS